MAGIERHSLSQLSPWYPVWQVQTPLVQVPLLLQVFPSQDVAGTGKNTAVSAKQRVTSLGLVFTVWFQKCGSRATSLLLTQKPSSFRYPATQAERKTQDNSSKQHVLWQTNIFLHNIGTDQMTNMANTLWPVNKLWEFWLLTSTTADSKGEFGLAFPDTLFCPKQWFRNFIRFLWCVG